MYLVDNSVTQRIHRAPAVVEAVVGLLFGSGVGRAAGVSDLQIAATALRHSDDEQVVTVVHYDAGFGHLARVRPDLRTRWIVAPGSVA